MSKKQFSKQQTQRIKQKQKSYQTRLQSSTNEPLASGLVISRYGSRALIEDEKGNATPCSIRPEIESLVAGDKVIWQKENEIQGVIVSCFPRRTLLGRPDKRGKIKPVAANITQIMVVVAPKPELSWHLLDSYLIIAEHLNLKTCIVLNKADLPSAAIQKKLSILYEPLGYPLIISSRENKQDEALKHELNHQISVFVGQSGVGKSSLIQRLLPHESNIATGDLSHNLGRHTTSNSIFYHLPTGGALIDSPGVREFGLWHMPLTDITQGYREFVPFINSCKYRNCNHYHAPDCAIINAVEEGLISRTRYENYVKICDQFAA